MQDRHDRLVPPGPLLREDGVEALATRSEVAKRVAADTARPVDTGDDPSAVRALGAVAEGELDQVRHPIVVDLGPPVVETLRRDAGGFEPGQKVILAD
jgi:hypothetical protein